MNRSIPPKAVLNLVFGWTNLVTAASRKLVPAGAVLGQDMSTNLLRGHVIGASVKLNIPDLLYREPLSVEALSEKMGADTESLFRLLRAMEAFDLIAKAGDGSYRLTKMGQHLASESPLSARNVARLLAAEYGGEFAQLADVVRSGQPPVDGKYRGDFFKAMESDAELADCFNKAMVEREMLLRPLLLASYDFSPSRHIVDIGGGKGGFLFSILEKFPSLQGTLFDSDNMVEAQELERFRSRCRVETGSFFDTVPAGGDLYILKSILHDWPDEEAAAILRNIRGAIPIRTKLLIVDLIVMEKGMDLEPFYMDLLMLTVFGGKERTVPQFETLLAETGFKLNRYESILGSHHYLEAEAV
jgi:hypothetical protein